MAIYKHRQEFELGRTENKSSKWLTPGTTGLWVRHADHSAILPPCCHKRTITQFTSSLSSGWSTGLAKGGASEFETSRTKGVSYLPRKERKHRSNSWPPVPFETGLVLRWNTLWDCFGDESCATLFKLRKEAPHRAHNATRGNTDQISHAPAQ